MIFVSIYKIKQKRYITPYLKGQSDYKNTHLEKVSSFWLINPIIKFCNDLTLKSSE